jgi:hypothetical protein
VNLPRLNHPELYQGLYIFDFGDHAAVGYTADEIEVLLNSPQHCRGRAYKIHHATPEGILSLRGRSRLDLGVNEFMAFGRATEQQARQDFDTLKHVALQHPPPAVVRWHLAADPRADWPHYTVLIYSAEHTEQISRWLQAIGFEGGDTVEGGAYPAAEGAEQPWLEQCAIAPDPRYHSRPAKVVLECVHQPIQREMN